MTIQFKLPEVSEGVESVDIGELLVKEGDVIEAGQEVMELETDKAVVPLACPNAGKVMKVLVAVGDTVAIGDPLLEIDESGSDDEASDQESKPDEAEKKSKSKETKEKSSDDEKPAEKESAPKEKSEEKPSDDSGKSGDKPSSAPQTAPAAAKDTSPDAPPPPAGPATRRLARELGVDLHQVSGTGPGGRITIEDVQGYVKARLTLPTTGGGGGIAEPALPDFEKFGKVEREKMNKLSRTAATNLSMAWNVIPHVTQHDLFDITDLEEARREFVERAKKSGGPKVTMTALAIKASVIALKEFPKFNSSFDSQSGEIVYKKFFNIGVAVDTSNGLVVPVIKDCDKKNVLQIAGEMTDLATRARDRKLDISEMQGATFTITNLGGIGGTYFTPIVNWPEVAILGMSRSQTQLAIEAGEIQERLLLPLSLSYDHRVVNGADAARFVTRLGAILSDPFQWLLES